MDELEKLLNELIDTQKDIHFTWGTLGVNKAIDSQDKKKQEILDFFKKKMETQE